MVDAKHILDLYNSNYNELIEKVEKELLLPFSIKALGDGDYIFFQTEKYNNYVIEKLIVELRKRGFIVEHKKGSDYKETWNYLQISIKF